MLKRKARRRPAGDWRAIRVLHDETRVQEFVKRLAREIHHHYRGEPFTIVGVLHACAPFMFDLMSSLPYSVREQLRYDFVLATSRNGTQSTGRVKVIEPSKFSLSGRNLLVVEGIVGTGLTLSEVLPRLERKDPKSIKVCALLNKPDVREARFEEIEVDFCGTDVPPEFVVGYGLDLDDEYRGLPYIGILE
jgi:hypoxanthine phosphoribosyltransferase